MSHVGAPDPIGNAYCAPIECLIALQRAIRLGEAGKLEATPTAPEPSAAVSPSSSRPRMIYQRRFMVEPRSCNDRSEVRATIDLIDREILQRLAYRLLSIVEAARLKPDRSKMLDEIRVVDVLAKLCATARAGGVDPDLVGNVYRKWAKRSIAHEPAVFDSLHNLAATRRAYIPMQQSNNRL
jgi:chorismate mutase